MHEYLRPNQFCIFPDLSLYKYSLNSESNHQHFSIPQFKLRAKTKGFSSVKVSILGLEFVGLE
jgi:hypothetical protein